MQMDNIYYISLAIAIEYVRIWIYRMIFIDFGVRDSCVAL